MSTVHTMVQHLTDYLTRDGIEDPVREAFLIMAHALNMTPAQLSVRLTDPVPLNDAESAFTLCAMRASRRPLSQVLGYRDFYASRFTVTENVLDPRPDTETLIEVALAEPFTELLDLGTGSGCIAISLLVERADANGIATDVSEAALEVAQRNARDLAVDDRLHFELSDWFEAVGGTYDLIVSNPPYISEEVYETLSPEVHHEPKIALTPGGDGLDPYRIIARDAPAHLTPGGRLLVETGYDQGPQVADLFQTAGLEDVTIHPDLNGKDRVVSARKARK